MYRTYEYTLAGAPFKVEIGRVAEQAGGTALIRYGETVVLCTATMSEKPRGGIDFFPLSCDYEERLYAVGKIPGGFIKREGRPSERAVLASRLIDRPIRPLFPEDMRNDVAVIATVWAVDQVHSPEVAAMIGANIALAVSDIPYNGPVSSLHVGLVNGELIICPDDKQREESTMTLTVSSTKDKVMMIEQGGNEIPEDVVYKGIMLAHEENVKIVEFINQIAAKEAKPKKVFESIGVPADFMQELTDFVGYDRMQKAVCHELKADRSEAIGVIKEEATEHLLAKFDEEVVAQWIGEAFYQLEKKTVRKMILVDKKRPDGRGINDLRKLHAEVDIVGRVHGSALFSRGQTQVMTVTTLASMSEVQRLDGLDLAEEQKRYMHHYNFPSYSVGETRPSRGPGRREIGHGALAEKALVPVLPDVETFPYAIRTVSEVVSSNGSTSQGAICGSSLSLMAAGVPLKAAVAGISVGLVTENDGEGDYVLIDDIQGIEDFFGDMDFKVAGTKDGITAIQLDMKIPGLTLQIIKESLEHCKKTRFEILDNCMNPAISAPRTEISEHAPKIVMVQIDPERMGEVIGPRGKVIHRIIDECGGDKIDAGGITIDTMDDGKIYVVGKNMANIQKAVGIINLILEPPVLNNVYEGKVTRIMSFGAFVEIAPEKEGMCHISQLAVERVEKVEDVVKVGDTLPVRLIEIDDQGRLNFSYKATIPGHEDARPPAKKPAPPRSGGGDRRPPRR